MVRVAASIPLSSYPYLSHLTDTYLDSVGAVGQIVTIL
jgi:hypothetical protein